MTDKKFPLKKSLTGFEVELFTIDKIKKECAGNMIEIASYPNEMLPDTMGHLLDELEYLASIAEKEGILLCPLGTYPGKFNPFMRDDKRYKVQEYIFGKNRFKIAGRCAGFHCHYTLPRGIFDYELRILKMLVRSKIKDSFVNSYNLLIAADPALACFMQSSPFYQGRYIGKDSRVIMYRGGEALSSPNGLYANMEEFGGLPHYKLTVLDIIDIITTRYEKWKSYIKSLGLNIQVLPLYGSILNTAWGPIRVSQHGTIEQRGMDMNHPIYIAGIGAIIKSILKKIQEEFYAVVPSEIGIKEPFKVEGDVIYIPPFPYVRNELQRLSAYNGLESDIVHNYCRRFLKMSQSIMPRSSYALIRVFHNMLNKKKTVSDEILDYARKWGWKMKETLSSRLAADISINHSQRLLDEITSTRRLIKSLI